MKKTAFIITLALIGASVMAQTVKKVKKHQEKAATSRLSKADAEFLFKAREEGKRIYLPLKKVKPKS